MRKYGYQINKTGTYMGTTADGSQVLFPNKLEYEKYVSEVNRSEQLHEIKQDIWEAYDEEVRKIRQSKKS